MNQELLQLKAELLKALAHPTRLGIIELLSRGERCVCELIPLLGVEQANLSQHLTLLRKNGLVGFTRDGTRLIYRLEQPQALLLSALAGDMVAGSVVGAGNLNARGEDDCSR